MEKKLKIIFLGTPEFASIILERLIECKEHKITYVITQPDRPKGRGKKLAFSPVKNLAFKHKINILQPENINSPKTKEFLRTISSDILVVAAFGQILSEEILNLTPLGALNIHASLLPQYRGASPIQWAILNGEVITGVTIMKMDKGLDTGPLLAQKIVPIHINDTGKSLHDKLAKAGADLLIDTLKRIDTIIPVPQNHELASYAPQLKKPYGEINWNQPVKSVHNHIRAMYPWPGAFFSWIRPKDGKRVALKIFPGEMTLDEVKEIPPGTVIWDREKIKIACNDFFYIPSKIQPQSGKPLTHEAFFCGYLK